MTSAALLVALLVFASSGQSSGVIVTSCGACHDQATCHSPPAPGDISCTCRTGFSGDGLACSPDHTVASSSAVRHTQSLLRQANPGSDLSNVRFSCGFNQCADGQDCLEIDGFQRCVDPCQRFTVLNETWRTTDNVAGDNHCDRDIQWDGYYRMFIGNRSASMPDQCVDSLRCGTQAPLWLASPHPRAADGIVKSSVCASFRGSCCWVQSNAIHVKACPGNYFVYKFVKPPGCYFAYCADVGDIATTTKPVKTTAKAPVTTTTTQATVKITTTTQPLIRDSTTTKTPDGTNLTETTKSHVTTTTQRDVCGTCQPGETCVSHDGVNWRCGMSDRPVLLRPELVCGRSLLQVGVDQSNLKAAGLDATTAHLADPRCNAHEERGGTVWYLAKRTEGTCGNTLETNGTHAIFSNSLFVYHIHDVSFTRPVSMPFSCYYPLESDASLDMAIKPYLSLKNATMGKGSKVKSTMTLYRDPNFTEVYPAGRVTLPVGSMLHVGVSIEESEMERFLVVLEDCYATQSPNPKDTTRYYIIQNKCASKLREVWVEENGSSLRARFSALLFQYHGDREDVFLHCSLSLCDQRTSSCSPVCAKRKRRTVSPSVPLEPLTIGPISYEVTK